MTMVDGRAGVTPPRRYHGKISCWPEILGYADYVSLIMNDYEVVVRFNGRIMTEWVAADSTTNEIMMVGFTNKMPALYTQRGDVEILLKKAPACTT